MQLDCHLECVSNGGTAYFMSLMDSFGSDRYTTKHGPEEVALLLKVGRDLIVLKIMGFKLLKQPVC